MNEPLNAHLIVPVGTQVVTRVEARPPGSCVSYPAGAVAIVAEVPTDNFHTYHLALPDGARVHLRRHEFAVRKHAHRGAVQRDEGVLDERGLSQCVIYRCIIGSRAYGLDTPNSDTDYRGIYLAPADAQWSLYGVPEQIENDANQECFWELQKFLLLALKANPNVLECLYTPLVVETCPLADRLLAMREAFLSKLAYQTYNGYVLSQFKRIEQDLRVHGGIRWKHAMHLVRLLLSGIALLRDGFLAVRLEEHRDRLLAVREGAFPWQELNAWRMELHREFDDVYRRTRLPDRPDTQRVNDFLIEARYQRVLQWKRTD